MQGAVRWPPLADLNTNAQVITLHFQPDSRSVRLASHLARCKRGFAMIRKTEDGYKMVSRKGKNLGGLYKTRAQAEKRLRQVEFFKRNK
jgi:hypothetical protein